MQENLVIPNESTPTRSSVHRLEGKRREPWRNGIEGSYSDGKVGKWGTTENKEEGEDRAEISDYLMPERVKRAPVGGYTVQNNVFIWYEDLIKRADLILEVWSASWVRLEPISVSLPAVRV